MASNFHREGLGYYELVPELIAEFRADHIKRSSDGLHCELTVQSAAPDVKSSASLGNTKSGHLFRGRANLSSLTALTGLAKHLNNRIKADWSEHLGEFARNVLEAESIGEHPVLVGRLPPRPEDKYLIYPLCPQGEATILFGDGEAGKSFLALGVAFAVKTGVDVVPHMHAHKGEPLYLDWETHQYEIDERIKKIAAGAGMEAPELVYRRMAGPLSDQVEEISRLVTERNITFIVIDSLEMALSGGENRDANDSVIRFFTALRYLRATTLVLDHVSKDGAGSDRGAFKPYGSTFKQNYARATWELRKGDDQRVLLNRKLNNDRFRDALGYQYVFDGEGVRFVESQITDEKLERSLPVGQRILNLLTEMTIPVPLMRIVSDLEGPKYNTVAGALSRLVSAGQVRKEGANYTFVR